MPEGRFKIGTLATMTGLGIPTLRNWERRYGLLQPQRVQSGHRLYTLDDLTTLRRVTALLEEGRAISEIASMGREALLAAARSRCQLPTRAQTCWSASGRSSRSSRTLCSTPCPAASC
jgi:MerR family transcriptional regulator, light-induced transcriptional regulator